MQTLIDLSNIADLEDRRVLVRDRLASANVRPWTPAIVRLADGHSVVGTSPELAWLIGEPLIDASGDYLPDLQFLRLGSAPAGSCRPRCVTSARSRWRARSCTEGPDGALRFPVQNAPAGVG